MVEDNMAGTSYQLPLPNMASSLSLAPPRISVADLYNPVMVEILVGDPPKMYTAPHALITGNSACFRRAFAGDFREGKEQSLRLEGVRHEVLEVFFGWLYTGQIFCEESSMSLLSSNEEGSTAEKGRAGPDEEVEGRKRGSKEEEEPPAKRTKVVGSRSRRRADVDAEPPWRGSHSSINPVESWTTQLDADEPTYTPSSSPGPWHTHGHGPDPDPETADPIRYPIRTDPITWPWPTLFTLYIFADAHDTPCFRTAVIEIIQIKMLRFHPYSYNPPSPDEYNFAFQRLPRSSPLYTFLLDTLVYHVDPEHTIEDWSSLPPSALAEMWLTQNRLDRFANCPSCGGAPRPLDLECGCVLDQHCGKCNGFCCFADSQHPGLFTDQAPWVQDMCGYHEHALEAEREVCKARWELVARERDIRGGRREREGFERPGRARVDEESEPGFRIRFQPGQW